MKEKNFYDGTLSNYNNALQGSNYQMIIYT